MLYREIIAVCSQIHAKHINTPCGQNIELLNVKPGGTCPARTVPHTSYGHCISVFQILGIILAVLHGYDAYLAYKQFRGYGWYCNAEDGDTYSSAPPTLIINVTLQLSVITCHVVCCISCRG